MDLTLPLRAIQALFTIIVLGLAGYVADAIDIFEDNNDSPSEINFLIFASIWTILVLIFLLVVPRFMSTLNKWILVGVEALTMIFWFAGFVALAVYISEDTDCGGGKICNTAKAACVFAAFNWLLWTATTILTALSARKTKTTGPNTTIP